MSRTKLVVTGLALTALLFGSMAAQAQDDDAKHHAQATGVFVHNGPPIPTGGSCDSINVAGVTSVGNLGDPGNTIINRDYSGGPCSSVDDIGWASIIFTAISPSWGSEATLEVSASNGSSASSIQFFPGQDTSGTFGPTSGSTGTPVVLLADEILRLEFWESFDDGTVDPDGIYDSGSIEVIPAAVPVELQVFSID